MHMVHLIPAIVISTVIVTVNVRVVKVAFLAVVTNHVFHVTDTDTENDVDAVLELTLTENLVLVQHFEVTA
jgi:hypothetical protein